MLNIGTQAGGNAVVSPRPPTSILAGNSSSAVRTQSQQRHPGNDIRKDRCKYQSCGKVTNWVVNFNGGTLKASANNGTLIDNTPISVNVYNGGAIFDTNGNTATVSANLLATHGDGIYPSGGTIAVIPAAAAAAISARRWSASAADRVSARWPSRPYPTA